MNRHTGAATRRISEKISKQRIELSAATLVFCPDALLSQWTNEIEKHVEHGYLTVYSFLTNKENSFSWKDIANYDIVLIPQGKFVQEKRRGEFAS